jgi:single-strand selective monofunctional uracil DNA glycosylase
MMDIFDRLTEELRPLRFGPPVTCVYNPLEYARPPFDLYLQRHGQAPKEVVLLGMNPGPFGMAQTGIPFGEVSHVRDWLGLRAPVRRPDPEHPKRPVQGFECARSEVSGARVWGWARTRFSDPETFFRRFLVLNYCPLVFMEESGRNRTPDRLPLAERRPLFEACDRALRQQVEHLRPRFLLAVGRFAEKRAHEALQGLEVGIACVPHPSPANPEANRGWDRLMDRALLEMGLSLP